MTNPDGTVEITDLADQSLGQAGEITSLYRMALAIENAKLLADLELVNTDLQEMGAAQLTSCNQLRK